MTADREVGAPRGSIPCFRNARKIRFLAEDLRTVEISLKGSEFRC